MYVYTHMHITCEPRCDNAISPQSVILQKYTCFVLVTGWNQVCVINLYVHILRHFKNSADTVSVGSTRTELHISALYIRIHSAMKCCFFAGLSSLERFPPKYTIRMYIHTYACIATVQTYSIRHTTVCTYVCIYSSH